MENDQLKIGERRGEGSSVGTLRDQLRCDLLAWTGKLAAAKWALWIKMEVLTPLDSH